MQYIQIKEAIAEQISTGMLSAKQKLPAERQLAQSFGTTRITLREALSLLEAEGVIYREDRRGWFISPKPLGYYPDQHIDFYQNAKNQQREPKTLLLKAQQKLANKEATTLLALPPFSTIYQIDSVHYLEDSPVAFIRHYLLSNHFPNLLNQDLSQSVQQLYSSFYQSQCTRVQHKIYTRSLTENMAEALRATDGAPSTVIEQLNYKQDGEVIDCSLEYWRHNAINIEFATRKAADT